MIVGGMPAAVHSWSNKHNISDVSQIHHDILHTYRDDFGKYSGRIPPQRLNEVMIVGQLLRTIGPVYQEPALYYWLNTEIFKR